MGLCPRPSECLRSRWASTASLLVLFRPVLLHYMSIRARVRLICAYTKEVILPLIDFFSFVSGSSFVSIFLPFSGAMVVDAAYNVLIVTTTAAMKDGTSK